MKYITFPYYINFKSHSLPIIWDKIDSNHKFFSYYDKLITIQIEYTKNNCKVFIHNTDYFYIHTRTCSTIQSAIYFIEDTLDRIVNHYILKGKYGYGILHDVYLYQLYELAPIDKLDPDYDLLCY